VVRLTLLLLTVSWTLPCLADEVEYRAGGERFARAWQQFYVEADHEPEIDDPLIAQGAKMVPAICEAVAHRSMKRRRYAIGALGYIGDRGAIPTLERVFLDPTEIYYFRSDALEAIYRLDREVGRTLASKVSPTDDELVRETAKAVLRGEKRLLVPSKE
jgi:hypothetical protein